MKKDTPMPAKKKKVPQETIEAPETMEVVVNAPVTPVSAKDFEASQKAIYRRCKAEGMTPEEAQETFDRHCREHMTVYTGDTVTLPMRQAQRYLDSGLGSLPGEAPTEVKRKTASLGVTMPNEQQRDEMREAEATEE